MDLGDKKFLVAGLGITGIEVAKFLYSKNASFIASDSRPLSELSDDVKKLKELGCKVETGGHSEETLSWADVLVLSPGVSFNSPFIKRAEELDKEIISEVELACNYIEKPIVAITGSNGKTTTTSLLGKILTDQGKSAFIGGNIGTPVISIADNDSDFDYLVIELSSFQLQGIKSFKPFIAILLNISPNHLDHHKNFNEYFNSKMRIFTNQDENDWAIFNAVEKIDSKFSKKFKSRKITFGSFENQDLNYKGETVFFKGESYNLEKRKLLGRHNLENAMCAIAAARILGCDKERIVNSIVNFDPLPHRIEYIGTFNGVKIYNDSKSTSPGATLRALESLEGPIVLLAGGKDKGVSYKILKDAINKKVKHLVLYGEAKNRLKEEIGSCVNTTLSNSLNEAVRCGLTSTTENDSLLFSPGCSSFDMFSSYEERGKEFKKIVQSLRN